MYPIAHAVFTIAGTQKQPKCPSTDEWIKKLWYIYTKEYSVQFSSVQSLSRVWIFWPQEPQHTRPPCPLPIPGVYPNTCPLGRWCHPTISCSVIPFSSCPQSFPTSGSFQMSQLFASGCQSTGISASTSVLPKNMLLSHKKECIWVSPNEVDESRTYFTEWSKSEREK